MCAKKKPYKTPQNQKKRYDDTCLRFVPVHHSMRWSVGLRCLNIKCPPPKSTASIQQHTLPLPKSISAPPRNNGLCQYSSRRDRYPLRRSSSKRTRNWAISASTLIFLFGLQEPLIAYVLLCQRALLGKDEKGNDKEDSWAFSWEPPEGSQEIRDNRQTYSDDRETWDGRSQLARLSRVLSDLQGLLDT